MTICNRCVMDTSANDIVFDDEGHCNFCTEFLIELSNPHFKNMHNELDDFISRVKNDGKNHEYDCIVGLSGGADSSYALTKAVDLGLRPLAVHMDNGWNSELAVNNIKNLVNKLNLELYTHVIEWKEYRSLMQAFFDADVIDIELLYDNAMLAVNYQIANKYGIKYILSGSNTATEGLRMPSNWNWYKLDKTNIFSIAKRYNVSIHTLPTIGTAKYRYFRHIKNIKWIPFLDYFNYNKSHAVDYLVNNYGYKKYPYKHYESIFTRFYQGYILPNKFGVDKRKVHLSTLIISGQMLRGEALSDLKKIPYHSQKELEDDMQYFLKKMSWTKTDLQTYLGRQEVSHLQYGSEVYIRDFEKKLRGFFM